MLGMITDVLRNNPQDRLNGQGLNQANISTI